MLLVWKSDISLPPSRKYNDFLLTDSMRILHLFKKTLVCHLALRQLHKSHQNEAALVTQGILPKGKLTQITDLLFMTQSAGNYSYSNYKSLKLGKGGLKFVSKVINDSALELRGIHISLISLSSVVMDNKIVLHFLLAGQGRVFTITNISCRILGFNAWAKRIRLYINLRRKLSSILR